VSLDVSSVSPSDAVVALRSYPRRFRAALTSIDPDQEIPDEAVAEAAELGRVLALVRNALGRVLSSDSPVLPAGVMDPAAREWTMPADADAARVLDVLASEAEGLASEVAEVAAGEWRRTGQVTGGGTVSALDLVREAVRAGHQHLRAAEDASSGR
jgi:hypothetical protein